MKKWEAMKKGAELGTAAFAAGLPRVPALDPAVNAFTALVPADAKPGWKVPDNTYAFIKAWLNAWDAANLAAPVEDL